MVDKSADQLPVTADIYAKFTLSMSDAERRQRVKKLDPWDAVASELKQYTQIDLLVFMSHGSPGQTSCHVVLGHLVM